MALPGNLWLFLITKMALEIISVCQGQIDGVCHIGLQVGGAGDSWETKQIGLDNLQKCFIFQNLLTLLTCSCYTEI